MVRLTADLVFSSPQYFNALREREIDLRGNKIAVVENLGATEDQFDSIDLSDNEIVKLDGFPLLKRLTSLLVNNNRIARLSPSLGVQLPTLRTLVLTNNRLTNLVDLDPLAFFKKLQTLSLLDNIVTKKPFYRLYVIQKIPTLRLLDFRKVKQQERTQADKKIGAGAISDTEKESGKKNTFVPGEALERGEDKRKEDGEGEKLEEVKEETAVKKGPTPEQITAIKAAIATAQTLEEVSRLERALKSGQLPTEIKKPVQEQAVKPLQEKVTPVQAEITKPAQEESMEPAEEETAKPTQEEEVEKAEEETREKAEISHDTNGHVAADGATGMEEG